MMANICTRSIGLQVSLCPCTLTPQRPQSRGWNPSTRQSSFISTASTSIDLPDPNFDPGRDPDLGGNNSNDKPRLCDLGLSSSGIDFGKSKRRIEAKVSVDLDMASNVNEAEEAVETDHLLERTTEETVTPTAARQIPTPLTGISHSTPTSTPPKAIPHSQSGSASTSQCHSPATTATATGRETPTKKEPHAHSYHQFKRKFNFRSDSVFSDVLPSSSSGQELKNAGDGDRTGSLSSLKPKESKWKTLKKKLGKLNSNPSASTSATAEEGAEGKDKEGKEKAKGVHKGLREKRSLLQRAKTLATILPTKGLKEPRDELSRPPKRQTRKPAPSEHPEFFNVGGEIDMIPLELLININDLNINNPK